jgi:predicted lipoprotein
MWVLLAVVACGTDGGDNPDLPADDFYRGALLENVANRVIPSQYEQFATNVDALIAAIEAYCSALDTPDEAARRSDAQTAYAEAMDRWQLAEVMLVGPASRGGEAIRDYIYSWPEVSACAVDQDVALLFEDPSGYDIAPRTTNRRGLYAIEYLVFQESLESLCAPASRPDVWDGLTDSERRAARCEFAAVAAADLAVQAAALVDAWRPGQDNFAGELVSAGEAGSSFETQTDALNAVFGALFYLDTATKDQKLAEPAGLADNDCETEGQPCLVELESAFADRSKLNVMHNLDGFELLFFGSSGDDDEFGFDNLLNAMEAGELVERITASIAAARTALIMLPPSMRDALEQDYDSVVEAHAKLRDVTTLLKGEIPATLQLEIPAEAGGDTD